MNAQLTTQCKAVIQCVNKTITDDFIRRYQSSTKNALENILCMGEAVNEIYQKVKSKELDNSDLEYFCQSVHLDPKGSTFRKYKAIGENASRFRQHLEKLPSTFSVLYEMATLSGDDFERYVVRHTFSKGITLEQFKSITRQSSNLTKTKMINPPVLHISPKSITKVIQMINQFEISLMRDIPKSKFDEFVNFLTEYRNNGWIQFDDPRIAEYLNEELAKQENEDDDLRYFKTLADQDAFEMRV